MKAVGIAIVLGGCLLASSSEATIIYPQLKEYRPLFQNDEQRAEFAFSQGKKLDANRQFEAGLFFYREACNAISNYKDCQHEIDVSETLLRSQKKLETDPENVGLLNRLALSYKNKGHIQDFLTRVQQSYRIRPTAFSARALAVAYFDAEQVEKGLTLAEEAVQLDSDDFAAKVVLAALLIESGQVRRGKRMLHRFTERQIQENREWYNVACSYAALGEEDKALHYLREATLNNTVYRFRARTDRSFDPIRTSRAFRLLVYPEEN